ncbi:CPBP family intramembrane glutamic endopeptidase [Bailinhaonella thermotolerans]|uniref:CPBP family intramembrane metalloprotease n=1 Tax=Bailinhaonella thermotolerans TaxID=1070861 RepID=A0A3A4AXN8_9ACTN|nr:CPBP family intramembrane glutamic endopeptidase [Bailinhaonella thermotolerans]RJL35432.1 CPBP family intramembrane metalloprotease [Bailinhaonella thermotolerans]
MKFRENTDLAVFLAVTYGLAWLVALPVWLSDEPPASVFESPLTSALTSVALMVLPALGVLAVRLTRAGRPWSWREDAGLTWGPDRRRTWALFGLGWIGTSLLVIAAVALSALLGLLALDLNGLSAFRELQRLPPASQPAGDSLVEILPRLASIVLLEPLILLLPALGEEIGWRGWLVPRLRPYGLWPALALSGVIWGAWHAPHTLLGYNYPHLGAWAALMTIGLSTLYGVVLAWLRLRSGSVWPAAVSHAAFNSTATVVVLVGDARTPYDPALASITGLIGWLVLACAAFTLLRRWPIPAPPGAADPGVRRAGDLTP